jgi:hypothetical protein
MDPGLSVRRQAEGLLSGAMAVLRAERVIGPPLFGRIAFWAALRHPLAKRLFVIDRTAKWRLLPTFHPTLPW